MEKIFVSNQLNEVEILKTLSKNGINTFGYRFYNTVELAKRVLTMNGIVINKEIISSTRAIALLYKLINDRGDFFKSASTYKDANKLYSSIKSLRHMCLENEIETLESTYCNDDKEKHIVNIYKEYKDYLRENNYIDDIEIIRMACHCKNKNIDITTFNEYNYTPLENYFFSLLRKCENVPILSLFSKSNKGIGFDDIYKCYGYGNEVERIFSYICEHKLPYSDVLIVTPSTYQAKYIDNIAAKYNLPIAFSNGFHVKQSNVYNFLNDYIDVVLNKGFDIEGIKKLYYSPSVYRKKLFEDITGLNEIDKELENNILRIMGNLRVAGSEESYYEILDYKRALKDYENYINSLSASNKDQEEFLKNSLSMNQYVNNFCYTDLQYLDYVQKFNELLSLGLFEFYKIYGYQSSKFGDLIILDSILKMRDEFEEINGECGLEIINEFMQSIAINSSLSSENSIFCCPIDDSINFIRKYIFMIGLDSSVPTIYKENYFVVDDEYDLFGDLSFKPTSINKIKESKKMYQDFLGIFNSLESHIQLSYSSFSEVEVREINQSSLLYEFYLTKFNGKSIKDFDEYLNAHYFGYEDSLVNFDSKIINELKTKQLVPLDADKPSTTYNFNVETKISASKLASLECPFNFFHTHILKFNEIDDQTDEQVITAIDKGNITHNIGEYLVLFKPNYDDYLIYVRQKLDLFICGHHCDDESAIESLIQEFIGIAEKLYEDYYELKDSLTEESLDQVVYQYQGDKEEYRGKSIILYGRTDRIDKNKDGTYNIVDYKSNRSIFSDDEVYKLLETLLYSYILNTNGKKVSKNQYVFTSNGNYVYQFDVDEKIHLLYENLDKLIEYCYGEKLDKLDGSHKAKPCTYCKIKDKLCKFDKDGDDND